MSETPGSAEAPESPAGYDRNRRFDGRVVLITGAARGQGEAEARLFAAEGAKVVVADLLVDEGEAVAASIRDGGGEAMFQRLDVTDEEAWQAAVAATEEAYGSISILVNNAGILTFEAVHRMDADLWRKVLDINVTGCFLGIKSVVRSMRAAGGGSIINISSNAGFEGLPYLSAYSSSKWAVRGLSRSTAIELGKFGIRVNSVHPGGVDTPMVRFGSDEPMDASFYRRLPIPRVGTVDDVAPVVAFLCSDEAAYITGAEFVVDGGHLAGDAGVLDS